MQKTNTNRRTATDFLKGISPQVWGLSVLLVAGFALRVVGIDFGLPMLDHPDEPTHVYPADVMARTNDFHPDTCPHGFDYVRPLYYLFMIIFKFQYFLESLGLVSVSTSTLYLSARIVVALFGTLMILAVYLVARKLYGGKIAIISSLFITVIPIAVRNSHYATWDIPGSCLATVALLFIIYFAKNGTWKYGLLAGVFIGLSTATYYSNGLLILPLLVASILFYIFYNPDSETGRKTPSKSSSSGKSKKKARSRQRSGAMPAVHSESAGRLSFSGIASRFISSSVISVCCFIAFSPSLLLELKSFTHTILSAYGYQLNVNGQPSSFAGTPGWIHHIPGNLNAGMSCYLAIASLIGVVAIAAVAIYYFAVRNAKNKRDSVTAALLLLSWTVPYYLIVGSWELQFQRNVIPLIPFLAIAAAYAVVRTSEQLGRLLNKLPLKPKLDYATALCVLIAMLLLISPLQLSIRWDIRYTQPTTCQVALAWIDENIPEGSYIIREPFTPNTGLLPQFKTRGHPWALAKPYGSSMSEITKADYIIITSRCYNRFYANPEQYAEYVDFYDGLAEDLTLVQVFPGSKTVSGKEIKIYRVPHP